MQRRRHFDKTVEDPVSW